MDSNEYDILKKLEEEVENYSNEQVKVLNRISEIEQLITSLKLEKGKLSREWFGTSQI